MEADNSLAAIPGDHLKRILGHDERVWSADEEKSLPTLH
jgi:hypothetical protein